AAADFAAARRLDEAEALKQHRAAASEHETGGRPAAGGRGLGRLRGSPAGPAGAARPAVRRGRRPRRLRRRGPAAGGDLARARVVARGMAACRAGDPKAARGGLRKGRELSPEGPAGDGTRALAWFFEAMCHARAEPPEAARARAALAEGVRAMERCYPKEHAG